jgi:hypothetical protein
VKNAEIQIVGLFREFIPLPKRPFDFGFFLLFPHSFSNSALKLWLNTSFWNWLRFLIELILKNATEGSHTSSNFYSSQNHTSSIFPRLKNDTSCNFTHLKMILLNWIKTFSIRFFDVVESSFLFRRLKGLISLIFLCW